MRIFMLALVPLFMLLSCTDDKDALISSAPEQGQMTVSLISSDGLAKSPTLMPGGLPTGTNIQHIWITLSDFLVSTSGDAWIHMIMPVRVDLIQLAKGFTVPMKMYPLEPGHYTHIAVYLDQNSTITVNGVDYPLTTPSDRVFLMHQWTIKPGEVTELCLDFNVLKAVHYAPGVGWMLHPTYKVMKCDPVEDMPG